MFQLGIDSVWLAVTCDKFHNLSSVSVIIWYTEFHEYLSMNHFRSSLHHYKISSFKIKITKQYRILNTNNTYHSKLEYNALLCDYTDYFCKNCFESLYWSQLKKNIKAIGKSDSKNFKHWLVSSETFASELKLSLKPCAELKLLVWLGEIDSEKWGGIVVINVINSHDGAKCRYEETREEINCQLSFFTSDSHACLEKRKYEKVLVSKFKGSHNRSIENWFCNIGIVIGRTACT